MRRDSKDLADCISKILNDYPKHFITDELFKTDQIRIRRRGSEIERLGDDDVIGLYLDTDFDDGKLTESKIRSDIQNWLQKHGKKI